MRIGSLEQSWNWLASRGTKLPQPRAKKLRSHLIKTFKSDENWRIQKWNVKIKRQMPSHQRSRYSKASVRLHMTWELSLRTISYLQWSKRTQVFLNISTIWIYYDFHPCYYKHFCAMWIQKEAKNMENNVIYGCWIFGENHECAWQGPLPQWNLIRKNKRFFKWCWHASKLG